MASSILVRRINGCRPWQLGRGDRSKRDEQKGKKISRKCEGPRASHKKKKKMMPGAESGAVAWLVSKKRLTWNASQKIELQDRTAQTLDVVFTVSTCDNLWPLPCYDTNCPWKLTCSKAAQFSSNSPGSRAGTRLEMTKDIHTSQRTTLPRTTLPSMCWQGTVFRLYTSEMEITKLELNIRDHLFFYIAFLLRMIESRENWVAITFLRN